MNRRRRDLHGRERQGRHQPHDRAEDADRGTVAFLIATAALTKGKPVAMFLTKEAVRLSLPGYADAIESSGAPPVQRLFEQYRDGGGELLAARSASRPEPWTSRPSCRMPGWPAPPHCGTGSERARPSSATESCLEQSRARQAQDSTAIPIAAFGPGSAQPHDRISADHRLLHQAALRCPCPASTRARGREPCRTRCGGARLQGRRRRSTRARIATIGTQLATRPAPLSVRAAVSARVGSWSVIPVNITPPRASRGDGWRVLLSRRWPSQALSRQPRSSSRTASAKTAAATTAATIKAAPVLVSCTPV